MVWLIAFLCGAVVMALEILGARILQPYFGSGILTWASLIAVFLAAMSGGYFLGGWLADRFPTFAGLGLLLLLASGSILLILPMERWLFPSLETARNFAVGMESLPERLAGRYGVLVAAVMFFWLPAMLLATASPYLIRLASKSVATTGRTAGGIYAVSTVGSIVGTLGCAFFLLPQQGVRTVLWELALVIAVVAIVCLLTSYRPRNGRHWLMCFCSHCFSPSPRRG
jgi:MFS family permease